MERKAHSADPARIKFGIFIECFMVTKAGVFCRLFSGCFTLPLCLCPHLQVALYIWGWCLEPSSGVDFQTKWVVNSACWSPWLSTVSLPSCHPLSKATACSSFVAWCPALGEYYSFSRGLTQEESGQESPPPVTTWEDGRRRMKMRLIWGQWWTSVLMCSALPSKCPVNDLTSPWPDIPAHTWPFTPPPPHQTSCYWATQYYMGCSQWFHWFH